MTKYACLLATFFASPTAWSGVVINEIFYHAPDDLADLQWVELYNDGDGTADLTGWMLDGGSIFVFPAATITFFVSGEVNQLHSKSPAARFAASELA